MNKRSERLDELLDVFDKGYSLCAQYDEIPHQYGEEVLYQSEMHFLQAVGNTGDITITTISQQLGKTTSACSQMVRKLKKKNLIEQRRNEKNNREYYLNLTPKGKEIYLAHEKLDHKCIQRTKEVLDEFNDEEREIYIRIQKQLNETFQKDVQENGALVTLKAVN